LIIDADKKKKEKAVLKEQIFVYEKEKNKSGQNEDSLRKKRLA
jgi:hypothetical protein